MLCYRPGDGVNVLLDLFICESNHGPTEFPQLVFSINILLPRLIVVAAVNLDDQLLADACEVGDASCDGMLTAELQIAQLSVSQHTPQE